MGGELGGGPRHAHHDRPRRVGQPQPGSLDGAEQAEKQRLARLAEAAQPRRLGDGEHVDPDGPVLHPLQEDRPGALDDVVVALDEPPRGDEEGGDLLGVGVGRDAPLQVHGAAGARRDVGDERAGERLVGDADQRRVVLADPRRAEADLLDHARDPLDLDLVADLERGVGEEDDRAEKVGHRVLGGEREREAADPEPGQRPEHVDAHVADDEHAADDGEEHLERLAQERDRLVVDAGLGRVREPVGDRGQHVDDAEQRPHDAHHHGRLQALRDDRGHVDGLGGEREDAGGDAPQEHLRDERERLGQQPRGLVVPLHGVLLRAPPERDEQAVDQLAAGEAGEHDAERGGEPPGLDAPQDGAAEQAEGLHTDQGEGRYPCIRGPDPSQVTGAQEPSRQAGYSAAPASASRWRPKRCITNRCATACVKRYSPHGSRGAKSWMAARR